MQTVVGNIWGYVDSHWIVIPTNIGWDKDGNNVMGRGLAKDASERYPDLAAFYGAHCLLNRDNPILCFYTVNPITWLTTYKGLIMFPTKSLASSPHLSWRNKSDINIIEIGLQQLAHFNQMPIAVPLLGCGNGGLQPDVVVPLIERYLVSDNFLLVRPD